MSTSSRSSAGRGRHWATAVSAVLAIAGIVLACLALAPSPTAKPAPTRAHAPDAPSAATRPTLDPPQARAESASGEAPSALSIPAIAVNAPLQRLGLASDGSLEVPRAPHYDEPGWFDGSPTPGEPGPAVIVGHLDGKGGVPSVFYRLGSLSPGTTVDVARTDGRTVTFEIYRVERYSKRSFPTAAVYGDTSAPELRLITCAGRFDEESESYLANTVVYARMIGDEGSSITVH